MDLFENCLHSDVSNVSPIIPKILFGLNFPMPFLEPFANRAVTSTNAKDDGNVDEEIA